jgi:hypothetical protein
MGRGPHLDGDACGSEIALAARRPAPALQRGLWREPEPDTLDQQLAEEHALADQTALALRRQERRGLADQRQQPREGSQELLLAEPGTDDG